MLKFKPGSENRLSRYRLCTKRRKNEDRLPHNRFAQCGQALPGLDHTTPKAGTPAWTSPRRCSRASPLRGPPPGLFLKKSKFMILDVEQQRTQGLCPSPPPPPCRGGSTRHPDKPGCRAYGRQEGDPHRGRASPYTRACGSPTQKHQKSPAQPTRHGVLSNVQRSANFTRGKPSKGHLTGPSVLFHVVCRYPRLRASCTRQSLPTLGF